MAEYYQVSDFDEYKSIFSDYTTLSDFVNSLNYCVSEERENEICDFMMVLTTLQEKSHLLYDELIDLIRTDNKNTLSVYLYMKFLLIDEEKQQIILNKFKDIQNVCRTILSRVFRKTNEELMRLIFTIVEDDILDDFMSHQDMFNNYRRLDLTNLHSIAERNDLTRKKMRTIVIHSREYFRIKFVYKLVYFVSDKNNTKCLEDNENSISPLDDFIRRFNKNSDTYIILWNYIYCIYGEFKLHLDSNVVIEDDLKEIIDKIPIDKNISNQQIFSTEQRDMYIQRLILDIIISSDNISNNTFNNTYENDNLPLRLFMKYKLYYQDDDYCLFKSLNYYISHTMILYEKYIKYTNSNLFQNLNKIYEVTMLIDKCNEFVEKDKLVELRDYLQNILTHYYYKKNINTNYI